MSFTNKDLTLINKALVMVEVYCFSMELTPKQKEVLRHIGTVKNKIKKMRKENNKTPKRKSSLRV